MNVNAIWYPLAFVAFVAPGASNGSHPLTPQSDRQSVGALPIAPKSPPGFVPTLVRAAVPEFVPELVSSRISPNLCAELDEYGDPARCEAVGPDMAPWWNEDVCCDASGCTELGRGGCTQGARRYWCESAVLYGDGRLDCVYEVPSYCEVFVCEGPTNITAPPLEHAICCFTSGCYDHEGGPCGGLEIWCGHGVSNEDGTISCQDGAY